MVEILSLANLLDAPVLGDAGQIMGVAVHGSNASFARPVIVGPVTWIGSVTPSNAINGDIWVDTA